MKQTILNHFPQATVETLYNRTYISTPQGHYFSSMNDSDKCYYHGIGDRLEIVGTLLTPSMLQELYAKDKETESSI